LVRSFVTGLVPTAVGAVHRAVLGRRTDAVTLVSAPSHDLMRGSPACCRRSQARSLHPNRPGDTHRHPILEGTHDPLHAFAMRLAAAQRLAVEAGLAAWPMVRYLAEARMPSAVTLLLAARSRVRLAVERFERLYVPLLRQ